MALKEVRIKLDGEQGSGKSQLLNKIEAMLEADGQVYKVRKLPSSFKQDKHTLIVTFETDPSINVRPSQGVISHG